MTSLENHYKEVYRDKVNIMSRILKGDYAGAEDVVQEAFTRAIKFYPSFDPKKGKLPAWFNGILFNALRDLQREMKVAPKVPMRDMSWEDVLPGLDFSNEETRIFLEKKISGVRNEKHQEVLYLFFILGYTSSEIAQIMPKMSPSNVTTIANRFKEDVTK